MKFGLTIIGSGSGTPLPNRYASAQVLNIHERFILIDCGEGSQINLRRFKINFNRIETILISHLHGDHFFGLPGLINTLNHLGRTKKLKIVAHKKIKDFIENIYNITEHKNCFDIDYYFIEDIGEKTIEFENYNITCIPLNHRIATSGFIITEKVNRRNIKRDFINTFSPSIAEIKSILNGLPFFDKNGKKIEDTIVFEKLEFPRSYAYISDTAFYPDLASQIQNVSLLYHEATFCKALQQLANKTMHSTANEAANIALNAKAQHLIIGHFSSRYKNTNNILEEARAIFSNTSAAYDGFTYEVKRKFNK